MEEININMTEEEAKEIIKNLFLMSTDWKIRKSYKGKLDFIGAIEGNEALKLILNLIQKQDTEINKLNKEKEYYKKLYNESYNFLDPKFTGNHIPRID